MIIPETSVDANLANGWVQIIGRLVRNVTRVVSMSTSKQEWTLRMRPVQNALAAHGVDQELLTHNTAAIVKNQLNGIFLT